MIRMDLNNLANLPFKLKKAQTKSKKTIINYL